MSDKQIIHGERWSIAVSGKSLQAIIVEQAEIIENLHKILGQKRTRIRILRDHVVNMNCELTDALHIIFRQENENERAYADSAEVIVELEAQLRDKEKQLAALAKIGDQ